MDISMDISMDIHIHGKPAYGITQCYLSPDISEHTPPFNLLVLDLSTLKGWEAELSML